MFTTQFFVGMGVGAFAFAFFSLLSTLYMLNVMRQRDAEDAEQETGDDPVPAKLARQPMHWDPMVTIVGDDGFHEYHRAASRDDFHRKV